MSNLQTRIQHLRSRARKALWLYGCSWLVATLLGAALALGGLDWLIHVDEPAMRLALSITTVAAVAVLSWRVLIKPLRQKLSDVALAIKIERRYPGFHDSLASTVEFDAENPATAVGSPELRALVAQQTEARLRQVDLDDVIDTRDVRLAGGIAVTVCLLVAIIAGLRPAEASLVVERFVFPFSAREWPRKTHLRLLDGDLKPIPADTGEPFRRVQGETFKFYVENAAGSLPREVKMLVRFDDGRQDVETLRRVSVRDSEGVVRNLCVANILVEKGPIRFRVIGGDDDTMPMQTIEAVPAPGLASFRMTLKPPEYSGRPTRQLPEGIGHFETLVGTKVTVDAVANTPLQSARLSVKSDFTRPLELSPDGKRFTAEFLIRESGNYAWWLHLKDRKGFGNPNASRYDIRAVADRVPVVRLRTPSRNITATRGAKIELEYTVEDDIGIRSVSLVSRLGNDGRRLEVLVPAPMSDVNKRPPARRELRRKYAWTLSDAVVGTQIKYYVQAEDDFRLDSQGRPDATGASKHVGKSVTRTITIVSAPEKTAEIARKYGELLEDLQRAEKQQRETHEQVGQLRIQLQKTGQLDRQRDLVLLKRVAREQRELLRQLNDDRSGVQSRAEQLRKQMRDNRLDNPVLARRLERIAGELAALKRSALQTLEKHLRDLETTHEQSANGKKPNANIAKTQNARLRETAEDQKSVLRSLRDLIGELSEWRNWQDLSIELKQLIKTQKEIHTDIQTLNRKTQGKRPEQLDDHSKADLARLAERQRRVSNRLARFREAVERFRQSLGEDAAENRAALATLSEVAGLLRDKPFDRNLQRMVDNIEANHLNETASLQKAVLDDFDDVLAALDNRQVDDLETLVKKQKQAEADLEQLHKSQQEVAKQLRKLGDAAKTQEERDRLQKLIKEQQQLRRKAADLARRLRRLSADDANSALQRAGDSMEQGLESLQKNELQRGQIDQRETLDNLQQARRELARERQRNERHLAIQQIEKFLAEIKGLLARQENVIQGTVRLREEYKKSGRWSPGRLRTLDSLRSEQESLRKRITDLAESTKSAAVFSLALKQVAGTMQSAAKTLGSVLETRDADGLSKAEREERDAKRQLLELVKSLIPERGKPNDNAAQTGDGNPGNAQDLAGPSAMAQLKLLKQMQTQLADRTAALDKQRKPSAELTAKQTAELKSLANEQQKLADLTQAMMRELGVRDLSPDEPKPKDGESPATLFRRAATNMRTASTELAKQNSGKETRTAQQQAIDDLDKLIRTAQRQSTQSPNQATKSSKSPPDNPKSPKKQSGQPGTKTKKNETTKSKGSGQPKKKVNESAPDVRKLQQQTQQQRTDRRERLIQEVWGHLPDHVKQQLRNVASEKYLPKYKPLINRYFESLAK